MSYKFNIFTNNFDLVGGGSAFWNDPVADKAALDAITTDNDGAVRVILSTNDAYRWNLSGASWQYVGKVKTSAVGSTPNANGLSVASDNTVTLQPADSSHPGVITSGTQSLGGNKTFANNIIVSGTIDADGGIDRSTAGTLTIGATNASTINIGNSGATVNIQGTTIYENTPQLLTADPLITVNHGGAAASGQNAGIQVEENAIITGYAETSSDRNSWALKAPNTTGVATIIPGNSGITLNQSSHDPVTLAAVGAVPNANGASLSSQVLNLQPADGTNPGVLTAGTQTIGGVKTFSSSPVVTPLTASQVVVTDAGKALASVVYSSANTNSAIVQRDGSGNFSANTITGSLTGAASLNVLKTGDTMSGALVMPATGSATTSSINFGTAGTGLYGTSSVIAISSGGTEVSRFTNTGLLINTTTADTTHSIHVKALAGQTGLISMESTTASIYDWSMSGNAFSLNFPSASWSPFNAVGSTQSVGLSTTNSSPQYPIEFNTASSNTTQSSITNGSTDFGVIGIRNKTNTTNNMEGIVFAGNSLKPQGMILVTNQNQTSGSETGKMDFRVANSGTVATALTINANKTVVLPGYTTAGLLSNDTSGNITTVTNFASPGDIAETSFSAANNQVVAANVTGLAFANAVVRSAKVLLSVFVNAATPLYESFEILLIQKGSSWDISYSSVGDTSGFVFTITTAGQIQYTNSNYTTFVAATVKFRAQSLSI